MWPASCPGPKVSLPRNLRMARAQVVALGSRVKRVIVPVPQSKKPQSCDWGLLLG